MTPVRRLLVLALAAAPVWVQAAPSAMGCLAIENEGSAMLWRNLCGHDIRVAYCSPNRGALTDRCGQGKDPANPFYTDEFVIPAGGVHARYHHSIMRYDYAVCPAGYGVRIISNAHGGFYCE